MTILILLVMVNSNPSVTHVSFESETSCLQAISKVMDFEGKNVTVKARCVKQ